MGAKNAAEAAHSSVWSIGDYGDEEGARGCMTGWLFRRRLFKQPANVMMQPFKHVPIHRDSQFSPVREAKDQPRW